MNAEKYDHKSCIAFQMAKTCQKLKLQIVLRQEKTRQNSVYPLKVCLRFKLNWKEHRSCLSRFYCKTNWYQLPLTLYLFHYSFKLSRSWGKLGWYFNFAIGNIAVITRSLHPAYCPSSGRNLSIFYAKHFKLSYRNIIETVKIPWYLRGGVP